MPAPTKDKKSAKGRRTLSCVSYATDCSFENMINTATGGEVFNMSMSTISTQKKAATVNSAASRDPEGKILDDNYTDVNDVPNHNDSYYDQESQYALAKECDMNDTCPTDSFESDEYNKKHLAFNNVRRPQRLKTKIGYTSFDSKSTVTSSDLHLGCSRDCTFWLLCFGALLIGLSIAATTMIVLNVFPTGTGKSLSHATTSGNPQQDSQEEAVPTALTSRPSPFPTFAPTSIPSQAPSDFPSQVPSDFPSQVPSDFPSQIPSRVPSQMPSHVPSQAPTNDPTEAPSSPPKPPSSSSPSVSRSQMPSIARSNIPTGETSSILSRNASTGIAGTTAPTEKPVLVLTMQPTAAPTFKPTVAPTRPLVDMTNSRFYEFLLDAVKDPITLRDINTPQGRALEWLEREDQVELNILQLDATTAEETKQGMLEALYQRFALVTLDYALHDSVEAAAWSFPRLDVCAWTGVACNSGLVTGINWSRMNLTGTIPPELGLLSNVVNLDIAQNQLKGSLTALYNLTKAKDIFVFDNMLTGPLTKELENCQNLVRFMAGQNRLTGPLPLLHMDSLRKYIHVSM
jgi:hypothetical protein